MQVKTSELTDAALDWAVTQCEGEDYSPVMTYSGIGHEFPATTYSNNWELAGPIIERERISVFECGMANVWGARPLQDGIKAIKDSYGETLLIAAMRCYVASKLGDTIDIPEGLI